jgi:hypothetical protein
MHSEEVTEEVSVTTRLMVLSSILPIRTDENYDSHESAETVFSSQTETECFRNTSQTL